MPGTERLQSALADRYSIIRELGSGGMATVYLARDLKHDREVALKVLRSDLSAILGTERFLSEIRISAKLDHPHILTFIDSGDADGVLYYVLPFVRGESLRVKLDREGQLAMDDALSITRQVASALDYAHAAGVIHRDIKPENILLHEGEAVLTDFGIALALREAGGARLTETGLSLGTPLYMSPEQATGDRILDKRSDIYSLAAVFYEMVAGEPPITGKTSQSIIAKLLTERPVKLRVVRPAIGQSVEDATEKALSKTPADRFASAGDFVRALSSAAPAARRNGMTMPARWAAGVAVAALLAAGAWKASTGSSGAERRPVALTDRTQLTNSGTVHIPSLASDGKSFAYVVNDCSSKGCRYVIQLQDLAGSSRKIVEGLTAVYGLELSPDGRHVLFAGTLGGAFGTYIVSALGGQPRRLAAPARFGAGGDSLIFLRNVKRPDSTSAAYIILADLDGARRDSLDINAQVRFTFPVPGADRLLVLQAVGDSARWHLIDRNGKSYSSVPSDNDLLSAIASRDALWVTLGHFPDLDRLSLVRIPLDLATGQLGPGRDTVYIGNFSNASVTADGGKLLLDERSMDFGAWAMSFDDVLNGQYTEDKRIFRSTKQSNLRLSYDGKFVVFDRGTVGSGKHSWSVMPFPSGQESRIPGNPSTVTFFDSSSVGTATILPNSTKFSVLNLRTGTEQIVATVNKTGLSWTRVGRDGWAWEQAEKGIRVQRIGESKPRVFSVPGAFKELLQMSGSPDGRHIAIAGFNAGSYDSVTIGVLSLETGQFRQLWSTGAAEAFVSWLEQGAVMVHVLEALDSYAFYKIGADGKVVRLGSTSRPSDFTWTSLDLKRAVTMTLDHRADAWMMKVNR